MGTLGREPVHLPHITIVTSFIDLTSLDLKLSGDGAVTISCGRRFHALMVRGRNECSNVLETITLMVLEVLGGHIWWKLKSMILVHRHVEK